MLPGSASPRDQPVVLTARSTERRRTRRPRAVAHPAQGDVARASATRPRLACRNQVSTTGGPGAAPFDPGDLLMSVTHSIPPTHLDAPLGSDAWLRTLVADRLGASESDLDDAASLTDDLAVDSLDFADLAASIE